MIKCFKCLGALFLLVILTIGDSFLHDQRLYFSSPHPTEIFQYSASGTEDTKVRYYEEGMFEKESSLKAPAIRNSWIFFRNFDVVLFKFRTSLFLSIKESLSFEFSSPHLKISLKERPLSLYIA